MTKYIGLDDGGTLDSKTADELRLKKKNLKEELNNEIKKVTALKWIDRVILWVADRMPSIEAKLKSTKDMDVKDVVLKALEVSVEGDAL